MNLRCQAYEFIIKGIGITWPESRYPNPGIAVSSKTEQRYSITGMAVQNRPEYSVNIDNKPYQVDVTWDIGAMDSNKTRVAYDYFNITDELINKDHKADGVLPKCASLEHNYFTKNKCYFKNKLQLMAYIKLALKRGKTDFYFRVDPRVRLSGIANEIGNMAAEQLAEEGQRGAVRIEQVPNEKVGTCWVRIY